MIRGDASYRPWMSMTSTDELVSNMSDMGNPSVP